MKGLRKSPSEKLLEDMREWSEAFCAQVDAAFPTQADDALEAAECDVHRDKGPALAPFVKIALSGPAGAGKDFVADALQANFGLQPMSLAEPIKKAPAVALGISVEHVEAVKNGDITPQIREALPPGMRDLPSDELQQKMRATLQRFGTELFRDVWGRDVWVNNLLGRVARAEDQGRLGVVVTDCRFKNEFDAFRREGFFLVDVKAPIEHHRLSPKDKGYYHASERDLDILRGCDAFDCSVWNDRACDGFDLSRGVMFSLVRWRKQR